jgi:RimJ/RimL family protein N-acetyltransferase
MMKVRFSRLVEVATEQVMNLLNDPGIARHMPLAGDRFDEAATRQWVESKDSQWERNGYGPWAIYVADEFAGWCGFQQENAEPDFAMVLRPKFWGAGQRIYLKALATGFQDFGYESIVVTLPPTRKVRRVLQHLGFRNDGETEHWGEGFLRFRLSRADWLRFANSQPPEDLA